MEQTNTPQLTRRGVTGGLILGTAAATAPGLLDGAAHAAVYTLPLQLKQGRVFLLVPTFWRPGMRLPLAVYHHGASSGAQTSLKRTGSGRLLRRLCAYGYCVAVSDFGGSLWGNQRNHRFLTDLIVVAQHRLARRGPVTLIGGSMGGGAVLSYAGRFPDLVRSVVALQPVLDLADVRRRYSVDRHYPGGYSDARYGDRHSPMVQASAYRGRRKGERTFDRVPIRLYYGPRDRVSPPQTVFEFAERVRAGRRPRLQLRKVPGASHGDRLIQRVALPRPAALRRPAPPPRPGLTRRWLRCELASLGTTGPISRTSPRPITRFRGSSLALLTPEPTQRDLLNLRARRASGAGRCRPTGPPGRRSACAARPRAGSWPPRRRTAPLRPPRA